MPICLLVSFPTAFGHSLTHSLSHSRLMLWVILQVKNSQSSENTATMLFLLSDGTNLLTENTKKKPTTVKPCIRASKCSRIFDAYVLKLVLSVAADISSCVWTCLCNGVSKAQSNSHYSNVQSCV